MSLATRPAAALAGLCLGLLLAPPAFSAGPDLKPVTVVSSHGEISPQANARLNAAMKRASDAALKDAQASWVAAGGDPANVKPLSLTMRALARFDREFAAAVAADAELRAMIAAGEVNVGCDMEVLFVDAATPVPTIDASGASVRLGDRPDLAGIEDGAFRMLALAAPRLDAATFERLATGATAIADMPVLKGEDPATWPLRQANANAYRAAYVSDAISQWIPLRISYSLNIDRSGINLFLDSRVKPALSVRRLYGPKEIVAVRTMDYVPHLKLAGAEMPIAAIGVSRYYRVDGVVDSSGPTAKIRYGRLLSPQDLQMFIACYRDCRAEHMTGRVGATYPTIRGSFDVGAIEFGGRDWLRDGMATVASFFGEYNKISVLLKTIAVDLTDPAAPRVIPDGSSFSVVMGADDESVQLDRDHDITFRGLSLYRSFVESRIAGGLSDELRATLVSLDGMSAEAAAEVLAPFAEMLGTPKGNGP